MLKVLRNTLCFQFDNKIKSVLLVIPNIYFNKFSSDTHQQNILLNKMNNQRHAQTQHGNHKLVDEENIMVLRKTNSPNPDSQFSTCDLLVVGEKHIDKKSDDESFSATSTDSNNLIKKNQELSENGSDNLESEKEDCVRFYKCGSQCEWPTESKIDTVKVMLPSNIEKRKADENNLSISSKKTKLETKDMKAMRPGFSEERYNETSYYFENDLRKVYPYYFTFTTFTKGRWVGEKILDVFSREFRAHPAEEYERCIKAGSLKVNCEKVPTDYILKHNDLLANIVHRHEVPVTNQPIKIVEMNEDIVVVNKPASIPVHPCGRYRHNTVIFILAKEYNLKGLRTIHRLDRLTSGLLLFGRNPKKAREMEVQIRNRQVKKQYICRVEGEFPDGVIECMEPIDVVSYKIGVCKVSNKGKDCSTSFEKLSYDGESSIVLSKPLTGRMHQIRVHLQYLGYPIINDPLYNHEVFGPKKGKGGDIGGKTDEQLVKDLITIHNAENWLGVDGDSNIFNSSTNNSESKDVTENANINVKLKIENINQQNLNDKQKKEIDESNPIVVDEINQNAKETKINIATQTSYDPPDLKYDPKKLSKDKYCYECKVKFQDPKPKDLIMYLHAWKYEGPGWKYETKLPDWAKIELIKLQ